MADQAAGLGAPPEVVAAWAEWEAHDATFEVAPENWPVIRLFGIAQTQWRFAGATPVGFDYAALEAGCRMLGHEVEPAAFAGLRLMEREILNVWAEKRR
jgi:hypothetical protein